MCVHDLHYGQGTQEKEDNLPRDTRPDKSKLLAALRPAAASETSSNVSLETVGILHRRDFEGRRGLP